MPFCVPLDRFIHAFSHGFIIFCEREMVELAVQNTDPLSNNKTEQTRGLKNMYYNTSNKEKRTSIMT
jgi:hypothetical protein